MHDQTHRGAGPRGPGVQSADRRVFELDEALRAVESSVPLLSQIGLVRDPLRVGQATGQALGTHGHMVRGVIVHALPGVHWYKVQTGGRAGFLPCCQLATTNLVPLGPRETSVLPPNSPVLVYKPAGINYGIILGVVPPALADNRLPCPDWLVQGGGSGLRREEAHKFPLKSTYAGGGVIDWSAGRPVDATSMEKGLITATGIAFSIDDFMAMLRVNEMCGLWVSYLDSWTRLAGLQLDIESAVHGEYARDDEGEVRHTRQISTYPWEALGLYAPGSPAVQEYDDQEVQYSSPMAKVDLPEGAADVQAVYRYVEYGGYLGQGHFRAVVKPALDAGQRRYGERVADEGVFRESIGLEGTYSLLAAKSIHIGKRCKIVVPREVRPPEDGQGDDAAADNYKFSGLHGAAEDHKVGDIRIVGEYKHLRRVAAVQDIMAYDLNWKAIHPFHYHKGDFYTPQESEQTAHFASVQERIDYSVLETEPFLDDPVPVRMRIDHRYGEVEYFMRESFLRFHDDGGVQLADGYGGCISMTGGVLDLSAPVVRINSGADLIFQSSQMCFKSKGSMDFSSSDADMRFKAEKNMQFLSGNSGQGGMLFECRGDGNANDYRGRVGEDVISNGIVLRASNSVCAVLGRDVYVRTGGDNLGEGDIVLDAGSGRRRVQILAGDFHTYTQRSVSFNYGPLGDDNSIRKSYVFGESSFVVEGSVLVRDKIVAYGDNAAVYVNGGILAMDAIATAGSVSSRDGGFLGQVPSEFAPKLSSTVSGLSAAITRNAEVAGSRRLETTIRDRYYLPGQIGNDETIGDLQFSFRDDQAGDQYRVNNLVWPEARWQMLARLGGAPQGRQWDEKPVVYQGEETYPWPGRVKWKEDRVFLRLKNLGLFDLTTGNCKDRPYDDFTLADWESVTMQEGFRLLR
jgi:hypothetical protein